MANYRLQMKIGKKGFAKAHAEFIIREGKYSKKHRNEDFQYKESGNMPKWEVEDPISFWKAADIFEPVNGRSYREFEVSLPNELTLNENINLLNEFKDVMIGADHAYTYAIHTSYNNGQQNTHAHFMFTERKNDGIERNLDTYFKKYNFRYPEKGGGQKDRKWVKRDTLFEARKQFALITNKHLERAEISERVDHRSNATQMFEAIEKGDLDKVEYLTRYQVNISKNILNKPKSALNSWEIKQISDFYVNRQIKKEKEQIYKEKLKQKESLLY